MNSFNTLVAISALTVASLTAHAQFTVDGQASATEIGTGMGKYQLAATYTGNHLDPDRGLSALYVGYTATTLNLMLVGSAESAAGSYRALVLYLNTPARPGIPSGNQLGGSDGQSPLKHKPTMDMVVDYGFRVSVGPTTATASDVYFSSVSYVTGTSVTPGTDSYIDHGSKAGAQVVSGASTALPGTKYAYFNTASLTANTTNAGLEIEIPLAAFGPAGSVTTGSRLDLFAAYTDGDGVFYSEIIPQITGRTTTLGPDADFTKIAGNQSIAFVLGSGVLATRNQTANALDFTVFPNPTPASAAIAYTVPTGQQSVSLAVYNTLGQRVRTLANAPQSGRQQFPLHNLPAGAYLVQLQIGDQLTSRKLVVQ